MARFLAPEAFSAATETLSLLPFNLERTGTNQYLVANLVGDFIRLTEDELNRLVDLQIQPGDGLYEKAYSAHLITGTNQNAQRQLLALRLRSRMSFLRQVTPLHIFVVTLAMRALVPILPGLAPKHRSVALRYERRNRDALSRYRLRESLVPNQD
jgi:uncharacterized protein